VGVVIFLLVLAFIGWALFTQISARQQTSVTCPFDVASARAVVAECFGRSWALVDGKGDLNYKPRLRARAPVISVALDAADRGGSQVDIWCSAFTKRYGLLEHGQLVWRKKRTVAHALAQAAPNSSLVRAPALSSGGSVSPTSALPQSPGVPHEPVGSSPANDACVHDSGAGAHMEFGGIKVKGDPPYRYREFWHVTSCSKCGKEMHREGDEYYGADMADIHWKWRR
jgi:hypothetical protein